MTFPLLEARAHRTRTTLCQQQSDYSFRQDPRRKTSSTHKRALGPRYKAGLIGWIILPSYTIPHYSRGCFFYFLFLVELHSSLYLCAFSCFVCLIHSATRSSALGAHSAASLQPSKIEIELYSVEKNNKKPACIKTRLLVNCPPVAFLTRKRAGKNSPYVPYEIVITKKKGEKNIYTHTYIYIYKAEALHNAPCLFSSSSRFSSPVLYLVPKKEEKEKTAGGLDQEY